MMEFRNVMVQNMEFRKVRFQESQGFGMYWIMRVQTVAVDEMERSIHSLTLIIYCFDILTNLCVVTHERQFNHRMTP